MVGAIRKRDVFAHPFVTIQSFGWYVFLRVIVAGREETFLSLLAATGALQTPSVRVPEFVDRCIDLELQAGRIYQRMASRFDQSQAAMNFFTSLARQERGHAELLDVCRAAAERGRWEERCFAPCRDAVPRLERQMTDAAASCDAIDDLNEALRLVIQIESSEINSVFKGIVAASDSEFVRKVQAFQTAGRRHIDYIVRQIADLAPQLTEQCHRMRVGSRAEEE